MKTKFILLASLLVSGVAGVFGQTYFFEKAHIDADRNYFSNDLMVEAEGSYVQCGSFTDKNSHTISGGFIRHMSSDGQPIWLTNTGAFIPNHIIYTNNHYICHSFDQIVALDPGSGDVAWRLDNGGSHFHPEQISITHDGHVLIVGWDSDEDDAISIMKISSVDGSTINSTKIEVPQTVSGRPVNTAVSRITDGHLIVSRFSDSDDGCENFIIKIDNGQSVDWLRKLTSENSNKQARYNSIELADNNTISLCGKLITYSGGIYQFDQAISTGLAYSSGPAYIIYDNLYDFTIGSESAKPEITDHVEINNDKYVIGNLYTNSGIRSNFSMRLSFSGSPVWARHYPIIHPDMASDPTIKRIPGTPNAGLVIASSFRFSGSTISEMSIFTTDIHGVGCDNGDLDPVTSIHSSQLNYIEYEQGPLENELESIPTNFSHPEINTEEICSVTHGRENSDSDGIGYSKTASLETYQDMSIKIFPNPSNGIVNIELADAADTKITVFDAAGNQVKGLQMKQGNTVQLVGLSSGVYVVNIQNREEIFNEKVIIK